MPTGLRRCDEQTGQIGRMPSFFCSGSTAGVLEWAGQVMKRAPVCISTRHPQSSGSARWIVDWVVFMATNNTRRSGHVNTLSIYFMQRKARTLAGSA